MVCPVLPIRNERDRDIIRQPELRGRVVVGGASEYPSVTVAINSEIGLRVPVIVARRRPIARLAQ